MNVPMVSVVIATHNRAKFFRRSLECYAHQTWKDFEIILLDDDSNDDMFQVCRSAHHLGLDLKHFWFKKPPGVGFRDCGSIMNYGIRAAAGEFIMFTSPEVMPGKTVINEMLITCNLNGGLSTKTFFTAKCYLLNHVLQPLIDTVDWKGLGVAAAIRQIPQLYTQPSGEIFAHDAYQPVNIEKATQFVTNMMCGMTRAGWKNMGGFYESDVWGPGDIAWLNERNRLGVPLVTLMDMDSYCVHQWHDGPDDIITPRDMNVAAANVRSGPWNHIRW